MKQELKDINTIVGKNFRNIRVSKRLTQEKIAEESELSVEYISKFENGKYNASIKTLVKLCKAIGITPNELLYNFFEDFSFNTSVQVSLLEELSQLSSDDISILLTIVKRFQKAK